MRYTIILIATAAFSVASAFYVWLRRPVPGGKTPVLIALAGAEWLLGYALEVGSADVSTKIIWNSVQYVGIVVAPTAWLVFVLQYTGREEWLKRRTLVLLSIVPFITLLLVFTNETHGLIWERAVPDTDGPLLIRPHGVGFWIHTAYSYTLVLIAAFFLVEMLIRSRHLYRRQATALLFAFFLSLLGNVVMLSGLNPFPYLDLTPLMFTMSSLALTWSLYRFRVGDIVPVASEVVIESISDGVVVLDEQDRIVGLNPAGQHMLDYTASGAIGRLVERIWPDWSDLIGSYGDRAGTSEEVVLGKGGARRIYDVRLSPISDWRGRLTSRVVVLRDITERKRAEEALRQRTAELQARNEELDAFAHTVAHDLQNPLGLVLGFAEALEQDHATMPDEELSRYLHTIARSVRRVSSIVDELLLLSEVPKMEVQARPLDMARIVAEAQRRLTHMIEEYQAEIISPETWPVALGYGPWIEGVWVNYLSNAIKYGGQPPRVELGATVQPDGTVRFWVRDNGPGLASEGQALLFTPFTRLDRVHADGHGLGLSIARRIVEKLDGQVGVESEVGRGSTFSFTLPGVVT